MVMALTVVILAAGQGSRICSKKSKVLQKLAGKTLIRHVVETVESLKAKNIIIVQGYLGRQVQKELVDKKVSWIYQFDRLGTGHAVLQALSKIKKEDKVLILYGDVPLISYDTLSHFIEFTRFEDVGILTAKLDNPSGLGRILRNRFGEIESIIEDKDANALQKQVKEINTGIYCVSGYNLHKWLPIITNKNVQKEYYLTDIIAFACGDKVNIRSAHPAYDFEILGVNTRSQLAKLERIWQKAVAHRIMAHGVSLADPDRFDVRGNIEVGSDTWIDINVLIEGEVIVGSNCVIYANCILRNCILGNNVVIKPNTIIEGSTIQKSSIIGPFSHIRPGSIISDNVRIGNFVEVKASKIGKYTRINHLSYIGDSSIGIKCNIGAGVVTCNYDGVNKYKTVIGSSSFIGSNCQLIAPLKIVDSAIVAAGSTVSKDVTQEGLTFNRANNQVTIPKWSIKKVR
jgi:bifunctional UDP-N-acetylglucosamine pyrophosphorylase/glucosamine-1-phosphate N-acetyltransferase